MDQPQTQQPQGRAKANFVRVLPHDQRYQRMTAAERAKNDRLPLMRGTISSPENPEDMYEFAVWDYVSPNGKEFLAGSVKPLSTRASIEDTLDAARAGVMATRDMTVNPDTGEITNDYTLSDNTIIIRLNDAKVLKSDRAYADLDTADQAFNAKRPLYWLKWQRSAGEQEVRGSLWDRSGRYGPFLDGNTQYPMTREAEVAAPATTKRKTQKTEEMNFSR